MPSYATRRVAGLLSERRGLQRVELDDGSRAYVLTQLLGPVAVGDPVVVNTTAVELGLGTGGWHVVHWNLARDAWSEPGPGHVMKLRYTSLQVDTGAAEEHDPEGVDRAADLGGLPVVACGLHSQLAPVVAAARAVAPSLRVAYVMTDGAALPLALSDLVADLAAAGLLELTVTAGHAFGGDVEAVTLPSALVVAAARADLVVVAPGPGTVGTATRLGFSALEVAGVLDAASALGGAPVAALRRSSADARERHRGTSHHSLTALALARPGVAVALPPGPDGEASRRDLEAAGLADRHHLEPAHADLDVAALLAAAGLDVRTMGRPPEDDPAFFAAAGAAGVLGARCAAERAAR